MNLFAGFTEKLWNPKGSASPRLLFPLAIAVKFLAQTHQVSGSMAGNIVRKNTRKDGNKFNQLSHDRHFFIST